MVTPSNIREYRTDGGAAGSRSGLDDACHQHDGEENDNEAKSSYMVVFGSSFGRFVCSISKMLVNFMI